MISSGPISLSAAGSFDMDYPSTQGVSQLVFDWSCRELSPDFGLPCPASLNLASQPFLTGSIAKPATYEIALTASNADSSSDTYITIVTVLEAAMPTAGIAPLTAAKANANARLLLEGSVSVPAEGSAEAGWTCTQLGDLASLALTPLQSTFPADSTSKFPLVLRPGSLSAGATYTFILRAASLGTQAPEANQAAVTVRINSPPVGGYIVVSPRQGEALLTAFSLLTTAWSDDVEDYPVLYSILYFTHSRESMHTVKPLSEGSTGTTTLQCTARHLLQPLTPPTHPHPAP